MKLFFVFLAIISSLALSTPAFSRGGHRGTFTRIEYDPVTREKLTIQFYVPTSKETLEGKKGWRRIVAKDDKPVNPPIEIDEKGKPISKK